jgi:hypothetical protein
VLYPTQVCALALGDSFFARCFLLSLAVDHPFLYCSSFIPFQTRSGLFLVPFPRLFPSRKPFPPFESAIVERHSSYPNSILQFT